MPELKHSFQAGRMNKDLDERLVPNGEYRDALNVEISTSEDSDVGSLQTTMGNIQVGNTPEGICVGSIADEKNDKLYYLVSGQQKDFIAEYDHATGNTVPVCVDIYSTDRALNFDPIFLITGINIIDGILFWTDNNSEPKRINIERGKAGSSNFFTHTQLQARDTLITSNVTVYKNVGPIKEEHLTVIKISPPLAPVLEMKDTTVDDVNADGSIGLIDSVMAMIDANGDPFNPFIDGISGGYFDTPVGITFNGPPYPDFSVGDYLTVTVSDDPLKRIRVLVIASVNPPPGGSGSKFTVQYQSGDPNITLANTEFDVTLEQADPLFQFKFPRFAYRYKYEDGEYSTFSPFTEVAFLPGEFDYLPKEGYNLGMVNNLRKLVIKDFVHERLLPDDVISIDILYKESNSPNIYSVKTIKRIEPEPGVTPADTVWDAWNANSSSTIAIFGTRGFLPIKSEMIHAVLPSNQLLRPWDNIPRKALAQEITKNRLVYGNYLQNYNLFSTYPVENNIDIQLGVITKPRDINGELTPEQYNPADVYSYKIAKSVKSLRTYQVGVVYVDEYGRETPVFSSDKRGTTGGGDKPSITSLYVDKTSADQANKLGVQINSTPPEWAKTFKFFVKETSNEYYNLAMDRWYDAEDGNIWLSFPSSERNKVDEDTYLILKKEHDKNTFVDEPARYKIIAIENEAPPYIKIEPTSLGIYTDDADGLLIGVPNGGGTGWPFPKFINFTLDSTTFESFAWDTVLLNADISNVWFRFKGTNTYSNWYKLQSVSISTTGTTQYEITSATPFGTDMALTSRNNNYQSRAKGLQLEMVRRQVEDKPEFQGRFFVKILKDSTIIDRIIKFSKKPSYIYSQTMMSTYINPEPGYRGPDDINPASVGVQPHQNNFFGYNKNDISVSNWNNKDSHSREHQGKGQEFWGKASAADSNSQTGWFIDRIEGFRPHKVTKEYFYKSGDGGSRENSYRTNPSAPWWWTTGSTYSFWDDTQHRAQCLGTGTHTSSTNINYLTQTGIRGPGADLRNSTQASGGIVPSVGIDNINNIIHLSYSGIGFDHSSGGDCPESFGSNVWDFTTDATKHTNDLLFINEITTHGTLWKWLEDPGDVIYQTTVPALTHNSTPQTTSEWSKNTRDQQVGVGEFGVSLYNYVIFSDYGQEDHHTIRNKPGKVKAQRTVANWVSQKISGETGTLAAIYAHIGLSHSIDTSGGWGGNWGTIINWTTGAHNIFPTMTKDWNKSKNKRRRFQFSAVPYNNPAGTIGGVAPHNYLPTNDPTFPAHYDSNGDVITIDPITSVAFTDPAPGIRNDGMHSGLDSGIPYTFSTSGTDPLGNTSIPNFKQWDANNTQQSMIPGSVTWVTLEPYSGDNIKYSSVNPAIWETEPKEDVGLDIYHEVGQIYPIELNDSTIEQFVGPIHSDLITNSWVQCIDSVTNLVVPLTSNGIISTPSLDTTDIRVSDASGTSVLLTDLAGNNLTNGTPPSEGDTLIFIRSNGGTTEAIVLNFNINTGWIELTSSVDKNLVTLPWFNCYSFGNGVESDRIRDDYNQVTIDNGPKASTTLEAPYAEERRASGLIYSGIYNSISGINNLNQFIQAEKITKDLNPIYGSIQKLHTRNTNLLTLCEDKIFKILANKDALYNADGNMNLTATANVLGQTIPLMGEFGISKNPESFASESYRVYFTDKTRGTVLRLSQDGLTPISDYGMKDYFSDNLILSDRIIGSFDDKKQTYNITLTDRKYGYDDVTVSFSENVKGWPAFKSFIQEDGLSLNNTYYTLFSGQLWEHHLNPLRNNYYGTQFDSHVDVLFNDVPGSVKSFQTLNYEGTQARVTPDLINNVDYYDNFLKTGWYIRKILTILHQGSFSTYGNWVDQDEFLDDRINGEQNTGIEFWDKEGKWFAQIKGVATEWLPDGKAGNIDTQEFSYQGIGNASDVVMITQPTSWNCVNNVCIDPGNGSGYYPTLAACIAVCKSNTSWDCNPGTASTLSTVGDCTNTTFITTPPGNTWDDFGEFTTNPANGYTSTPPDQLGTCLLPYTGWGRTGPFIAATNSGITNHFDWVRRWCASPLGPGGTFGYGNTTCCSCGSNNDGVYVYGYRYYLSECRTLKALGPPDPAKNPCVQSGNYVPPVTGNPITGAVYPWGINYHLHTSVANYTSWEGFLTKLLTLQPSLGTTYGVSLATTDLAALTIALDQFYNDINTNDPTHNYHWELPNVESRVCDCENATPTPTVPGTPCTCIERQDLSGQYPTEQDCLTNCCPDLVTSWNCTPSTSTLGSVFTCDNGIEINGGGMFADMFEYNQYISDPVNNLTNIPFIDMYACVEKTNGTSVTFMAPTAVMGAPAVPTTYSHPIPVTACECNNGLGVLVNSSGINLPQGNMNPWPGNTILTSPPPTWNSWILILNNWGITPSIPLDTPYYQVQQLVDLYLNHFFPGWTGFGYVYLPPITPSGNDFCLCEGDPGGCTCVEVQGASGTYPTESSCLSTCCNAVNPSWDCVKNSCIDPGTGLGQYSTLSACNAACNPILPSWDCVKGNCIDPGNGLGKYSSYRMCDSLCSQPSWDCVSSIGLGTFDEAGGSCVDPGNGLGQYLTLAACNARCGQPILPSWDCESGICGDPGDGSGQYPTFAECHNYCSPLVKPTWNCVQFDNGVSICNDPGTGEGQYEFYLECQDACFSIIPPVPPPVAPDVALYLTDYPGGEPGGGPSGDDGSDPDAGGGGDDTEGGSDY